MATTTTNYSFVKPDGDDFVNEQTQLNNNLDAIDNQIKAANDARISGDNSLDSRLDAVEPVVLPAQEYDAAGLGITAAAGWTLNIVSGYKVGRMRFLTITATYSGATATGGSSGNIGDQALLTNLLPATFRPSASLCNFVWATGGTVFGQGDVNTTGQITLRTMHVNAQLNSGDVVSFTAVYVV